MTAQRQEQCLRARADDPAAQDARQTAQEALAGSRIIKKFAPRQAGARSWALRFGDDLPCVRYRVDAAGARRYTTVELVADAAPLGLLSGGRRSSPREAGARWDTDVRLWRLSKPRRSEARAVGASCVCRMDGRFCLQMPGRSMDACVH